MARSTSATAPTHASLADLHRADYRRQVELQRHLLERQQEQYAQRQAAQAAGYAATPAKGPPPMLVEHPDVVTEVVTRLAQVYINKALAPSGLPPRRHLSLPGTDWRLVARQYFGRDVISDTDFLQAIYFDASRKGASHTPFRKYRS